VGKKEKKVENGPAKGKITSWRAKSVGTRGVGAAASPNRRDEAI